MDYTIVDLLIELSERQASDLHLTANIPPTLRVHGRLVRLDYEPLTPEDTRGLAFSIMREDQRKRLEKDKEIDFGYSQKGIGRFRVNCFWTRGNIAVAMRSIPERIPTMEELLIPEIIHEVIQEPRGLCLVTGPTGSGKTTTLASMLNVINENSDKHIITIEDPIEYMHDHKMSNVNQRELGNDTLGFNLALIRALRQDPDVILIGEMRDLETISTAITAAETGHLVFATLHTSSAPATIDRIIDVFPFGQQDQIRAQLANALQCVMCQALLPRADGGGRIAAFEVMINIPAIRNLIRERKIFQIHSTMMTHSKLGMTTLDQCLRDMYFRREITLETAMVTATSPSNLQRLIAAGPAGTTEEAAGEMGVGGKEIARASDSGTDAG
ncbi:type IV pilus twitching motility protein PilT [bacterium]|nr:type IV pilus twitching motility protein PilT [bacterium]MBU1024825.1 type IV pilus twitching motility protein PilT [bacterium]